MPMKMSEPIGYDVCFGVPAANVTFRHSQPARGTSLVIMRREHWLAYGLASNSSDAAPSTSSLLLPRIREGPDSRSLVFRDHGGPSPSETRVELIHTLMSYVLPEYVW